MFLSAMTNLPREIAEQEAIINQKLYMFLGQHDQFAFELKKSLSSVNGSDDLVQDIITHCADCVDGKRYLLPETKHSFLKVRTRNLFFVELLLRPPFHIGYCVWFVYFGWRWRRKGYY